ncbi:ROK family transcriptional regulator [Leifsonia poae]|uniref:ROK family transcriptional regulator n=1 Tax=Leifsonia poae TaxID=110933 RepID=UPI001CBCB33D|nr:ROK family protein [Leifsonia poae]
MDGLLAGPQGLLWALNARAVLAVLDARGQLARPELVAATGLSRTTVTQTVQALVGSGVIAEAGLDRTRRGPAAVLYRLVPDTAFGLAVHSAPDHVRVAVVDASGEVRARAGAEVAGMIDGEEARAALILELAADAVGAIEPGETGAAAPRLRRAVVGIDGIVGADGRTLRTVPGYAVGGTALHDALQAGLDCPVTIENDINLSALAEQCGTAVGDARTFAVLSLDSGFGAGLVIDGRLYRGAAGGAGEVAYLPQPGLRLGAESLGRRAIADLASAEGLPSGRPLSALLHDAAAGDGRARRVVAEVGRRLALSAASVALVLDPDLFVLTDLAADDLLVTAVTDFAATAAAELPMRFVPSALQGEGVLLGAIGQVHRQVRDDVFDAAVAADSAAGSPIAS